VIFLRLDKNHEFMEAMKFGTCSDLPSFFASDALQCRNLYISSIQTVKYYTTDLKQPSWSLFGAMTLLITGFNQ